MFILIVPPRKERNVSLKNEPFRNMLIALGCRKRGAT